MTNVKFNGRTFSSLVDDFLTEMPALLKTESASAAIRGHAPANITEKENTYEIDIAAPGYEKTDFHIHLDKNLLTISAAINATNEVNENEKSIRKEFHLKAFKRSFTIDDKINTEGIEARYVNGILKVTLARKEDAKTPSKDITVQ